MNWKEKTLLIIGFATLPLLGVVAAVVLSYYVLHS